MNCKPKSSNNFRKFIVRRTRKKKGDRFEPTHEFVAKSVDVYLQSGGRITRIEKVDGQFQRSVDIPPDMNFYNHADQYLRETD